MTDDRELADRVLALFGQTMPGDIVNIYLNHHMPENFVRDWRVAGALMQRCNSVAWCEDEGKYTIIVSAGGEDSAVQQIEGPIARAIIEACVKALEGGSDE